MKLLTYKRNGCTRVGALDGNHVLEFPGTRSMESHLASGCLGFTLRCAQERHWIGDIELLPPVLKPGKIICVGLNYRSHLALLNEPLSDQPMLFFKPSSSLIAAGGTIVIPRVSRQVDYEGELAVVIGKSGKYIREQDALSYVGGYTCANDVSAHDIEFRAATTGKMLDTFCPLGPVLVTADEIPNPDELHLQTTLNGEVVQDAFTWDMRFSVAALISSISSLATLEPGDVILTGTPAGLGCMRNPQVFLKPGDCITVAIDGIGELTNRVVPEYA
jgi:2-keto-4-pentenoate hydratase/2-oxohepta-3-ene-1,7-dioic acid hydratase in catechol pathway